MILAFLLACAADKGGEAEPAPTVEWLIPTDGETVTAGEVECSLVVSEFTLESRLLHGDAGAAGYVEISVDGTVALETDDTTPTLSLEAGQHELVAQLFYEDGDPVLVADDLLCDEGAEEGCAPVTATVNVTAE